MSSQSEVTSRLWGEWEPRFYGSGTTIVGLKCCGGVKRPHLYIYADADENESRYMRARYRMCDELAAFMNGGERPTWLDDMERQTEGYAESLAGANITAVGPMVDRDPPNLDWVWDDSEEAKSDRARLMDVLFLTGKEPTDV